MAKNSVFQHLKLMGPKSKSNSSTLSGQADIDLLLFHLKSIFSVELSDKNSTCTPSNIFVQEFVFSKDSFLRASDFLFLNSNAASVFSLQQPDFLGTGLGFEHLFIINFDIGQ